MSNGSVTWNYTYDANGMHTKCTGGGVTYTYVYNGSQPSQMTVGNNTLDFVYDATGTPVMVFWNGTPYYYVTNLQGDVLLILDAIAGGHKDIFMAGIEMIGQLFEEYPLLPYAKNK